MRAIIRALKAVDAVIAGVELALALLALLVILALTAIPLYIRSHNDLGDWVVAKADAWFHHAMAPVQHIDGSAWAWTSPMALYLLLAGTFFGASLAMRQRRHIQIDVVTRLLPRRAKAAFGVVGWTVALLILGLLTRAAIYLVIRNWGEEANPMLKNISFLGMHVDVVRLGPAEIAMPIALGIMALRCFVALLEDLRGAVTGDTAYMAAFEHVEGEDLAPKPDEVLPDLEKHEGGARS